MNEKIEFRILYIVGELLRDYMPKFSMLDVDDQLHCIYKCVDNLKEKASIDINNKSFYESVNKYLKKEYSGKNYLR